MVTKQKLRVLLLAILLAANLGAAKCPSEDELTRAAKASNELAHDLVIANKVVAELFLAKRISLAKKDEWADKLGRIGEKAEVVNFALMELDHKYPEGTVPPDNLVFLRENFAVLKRLYDELLADMVGLGAQGALKELGKDISTMEEVTK